MVVGYACVCSMHEIYCLQLERFLCRDCGKVKCSCDLTTSTIVHPPPPEEEKNTEPDSVNDSVEFRRARLTRQLSGPETNIPQKPPPHLTHRSSEQPFTRSVQGENGKLRRSFAVRSRDGLENLFSFASIRKAQDATKAKQAQRL